MRAPVSWIREYADLPADLSGVELARKLTALGLKLESLHRPGGDIRGPLVVGRVLTVEAEPQKNGKTINWCTVDVGAANGTGEPQGIVCGAHNFTAGDLVVVVLPGGVLPGGFEPALGPNRAMMAFLLDAYTEDEAPNTKGGVDKRTVLRLDPRLAPVKVAVLPLSRNADLSPKARDLAAELRGHGWNVDFDDSGAIGRRYRRQDEIGTPYCVTVDFDTLEDHAVTVRERDSM
jgi:tRNA-binding EMAP/Myf-like protein